MVSPRMEGKSPKVKAIVTYLKTIMPNYDQVAAALDMNSNTLRPRLARGDIWPLLLDILEILDIETLEVRKILEDYGLEWKPGKFKTEELSEKKRPGRPRKFGS